MRTNAAKLVLKIRDVRLKDLVQLGLDELAERQALQRVAVAVFDDVHVSTLDTHKTYGQLANFGAPVYCRSGVLLSLSCFSVCCEAIYVMRVPGNPQPRHK